MLEATVAIGVLVGIVEVIKRAFAINSKYAPLISLILGVLFYGMSAGWNFDSVFTGIVIGLSASGLYSGTKAVVK